MSNSTRNLRIEKEVHRAALDSTIASMPNLQLRLSAIGPVPGGVTIFSVDEDLQLLSEVTRMQLLQRAMYCAGHRHHLMFFPAPSVKYTAFHYTGVQDGTHGLGNICIGDEAMQSRVAPMFDLLQ